MDISLRMTGKNTKSAAFVYGAMSFTDKVDQSHLIEEVSNFQLFVKYVVCNLCIEELCLIDTNALHICFYLIDLKT